MYVAIELANKVLDLMLHAPARDEMHAWHVREWYVNRRFSVYQQRRARCESHVRKALDCNRISLLLPTAPNSSLLLTTALYGSLLPLTAPDYFSQLTTAPHCSLLLGISCDKIASPLFGASRVLGKVCARAPATTLAGACEALSRLTCIDRRRTRCSP